MSKFLKTILSVALLGVFVFAFQQPINNIWRGLNNKYLPCRAPIKYSLGIFDEQFGISKQEFLRAVKTAEDIWEGPAGKDLFAYDPDGALRINLIYDDRQEATTKLQKLGIAVGDDKASYENLKSKYSALQKKYEAERNTLEERIEKFEIRQDAYEDEVASWNEKGGAEEADYARLNNERKYLENEVVEIKKKQSALNQTAGDINAMVIVINRLVSSLNIQVDRLNAIGQTLGEFEEGTYQSGPEGQKIEIYQFDNRNKLIRVLAHEFGHALGLEHLEDAKAIMYRLNNGINEKLTQSDLDALQALCGIE
ncbi:MAG TPA: matrixin family metalloprotease [Candidatus Paceibacterota bacterium]|nr:matrixin family metalloprotease [Candidatus Paceibacterota bacterium]